MERTIKRGDIYYAELNPVIGSEQGGKRPVLIISNDIGNKHSPTVIVAPITSRVHTKAKLPTHTSIKDFEGLDKNSIIVYTVEGNSGDSCRQCHRAVGNYEILGYGVLIP